MGLLKKASNGAIEKSLISKLTKQNEYGFRHQHFDQIQLTRAEYDYLKERGLKDKYTYENGAQVPLHPMCINCQARHIVKYKDKHDAGEEPFQVRCKGVPSELPPGSSQLIKQLATEKNMSLKRAQQIVAAAHDPVAWAELMLGFDDSSIDSDNPWYLRPYQKEQLRCLHGSSDIFMADGSIKKLEDVQVGDKVLAYNKSRRSYVSKRVLKKWSSGIKDVYRITSSNGDSVLATEDHPFLSYVHSGNTNKLFDMPSKATVYRSLKDGLASHPDDRVYVSTHFERFGDIDNDDLAKLLGYIVSDGYVNLTNKFVVEFRNIRKQYVDEFEDLVGLLFPDARIHRTFKPEHTDKKGVHRQDTWSAVCFGQSSLTDFLVSIGCIDKHTRELALLTYAYKFSKFSLALFINRVWAGDGCIYSSRNPTITERKLGSDGCWKTVLTLSSGNVEFLKAFRWLLRKFGIYKTFIYKQHKEEDNNSYGLNIQSIQQVLTFFQQIGPIFGKEDQSFFAMNHLVYKNKTKGAFKNVGRLAIDSIEYVGQEKTYDIEVDGLHNFIADGFIVHNCTAKRMVLRQGRRSGKTLIMSLKLLFLAFNMIISKGRDSEGNEVKTGPQIIVTTPFQAQLENIFMEMERLLKRNVDLVNQVTSEHNGTLFIKTPFFKMTFANGAVISGFVTGVEIRQDGSAGGSLRGQSGHVIYVDEMDMVPEDVLNKVIIPILFTAGNTIFYASSTPIGKAGHFRRLCKERPDFKEDYLPSTVLPHWETEKKELGKIDPTDDSFIAEYMAEFIDGNSGVFKADYVFGAMANYEYTDSRPDNWKWQKASLASWPDIVTSIGIDWNKNAGSEFVVVRMDPTTREYWIVEAVNVPASKFSSVTFKEQVIRLNHKWKPSDNGIMFIYADEGYGHHIIDDLLYDAQMIRVNYNGGRNIFEQQQAFLLDRLKKFNFSQKVELVNPVDGTTFQRTGKEFLVENAVRVFETGRIHFPASDETLKEQLLNYCVLRRHASNGRPVYGMRSEKIGDHRLDALMLALGGIFLETDTKYSLNNRGIGSPPGLIEKDTLMKRYEVNHKESDQSYFGVQPGGYFEFLEIQRTPADEPDGPGSSGYFEKAPVSRIGKSPKERSRSEFSQVGKPTGILEMIQNQYSPKERVVNVPAVMGSQESPFVSRKRRHGKHSRGWK